MKRASLALILLGVPSASMAETILYCNDYVVSADRMGLALDTFEGIHAITRTTSLSGCESMIASGSWDLVIYAVQNSFHSSPQLNSYVASGGFAIMQDWTTDSARASTFGIGWATTNYSTLTVTDPRLTSGLGSGFLMVSTPYLGWGIFSQSFSVYSGEVLATSAYGSAAIGLTNDGRTIVNGFLTDTVTDTGARPANTAT